MRGDIDRVRTDLNVEKHDKGLKRHSNRRRERLRRSWESRENAVHRKRMELEIVWTEKEGKLREERRELEKKGMHNRK